MCLEAYYLKLKENFFDSDEAIILESMPDGYIYSNILLKLYLRSLKNNGLLMFNDIIPYNSQMLSTITRHQVGTIEKAISIFKDLRLIEVLDNGAIYMANIENFVGKSSSEGDRKRKRRAELSNLNLLNGQMSGQMSDKRPPEIELEIEKDIELKIDTDVDVELDYSNQNKNENNTTATADNSLKNLFDYYQERIGLIDSFQYQSIVAYIEDDNMDIEVVKSAIGKAADNGKRNFKYLNSILKNWKQNGIKTLAQVEDEERSYSRSKDTNVAPPLGSQFPKVNF